jgi:hypothetical protein
MKIIALFKKARGILLVMLAVYLLSFGAGYLAGKRGWTDGAALRTTKIFELNRNLEFRVPGYGALLQKYKDWERPKLMTLLFKGQAVPAMFLIYFNNWIVADLTMMIRTVFLVPLALYPYGRFVQGVTLAQSASGYQVWMIWLTEFGGYFLVICGTLIVVLWTLFAKRWGFSSRRKAFLGGLKLWAVLFGAAGVFFLVGSYVEMIFILGMSLR